MLFVRVMKAKDPVDMAEYGQVQPDHGHKFWQVYSRQGRKGIYPRLIVGYGEREPITLGGEYR